MTFSFSILKKKISDEIFHTVFVIIFPLLCCFIFPPTHFILHNFTCMQHNGANFLGFCYYPILQFQHFTLLSKLVSPELHLSMAILHFQYLISIRPIHPK
jgi:hypothetical protein